MPSSVHEIQEQAEATFIAYGPPREDGSAIEIADTFGQYEAEYAAIRKGCGFFESPHRATVVVRGAERVDFLQKMLTNDVKLGPGQGRRAMLLAGRVVADIIVLVMADEVRLVVDSFDAAALVAELQKFIIMEDVEVRVEEDSWHLALHGPQAAGVAGELVGAAVELEPFAHRAVEAVGFRGMIYRRDEAGSPGYHVVLPKAAAGPAFAWMMDRARRDGWRTASEIEKVIESKQGEGGRSRIRPIGWLAYNTARIEAGTPLFHVDFGPDALPAETGVLDQVVSFTKGCYLGQEIVARLHNLGHPKRVLVGLKLEDDRMPVAGTLVAEAGDDAKTQAAGSPGNATANTPVGAVTSSTLSPMLGNVAIAFAVMKWGKHRPGTRVTVPAEGSRVPATVQALSFLQP